MEPILAILKATHILAPLLFFTVNTISKIGATSLILTNSQKRTQHRKPETGELSGFPSFIIYAVVGMGLCFIIATIGCLFFWRKYRTTKPTLRSLSRQEVEEFFKGNPDKMEGGEDNDHECAVRMPYNKKMEIKSSDLVIDHNAGLGKGTYGLVVRGSLQRKNVHLAVAVKTTHLDADAHHFKALLEEIKIMAYVGHHPNLIQFMGALTNKIKQGLVYVVVELSPIGNLKDFLKSRRNDFSRENLKVDIDNYYLSLADESAPLLDKENSGKLGMANLVHFAFQISNGMEHLALKKILHGDLAIRNVLVFDKNVVKITDFGLSKKLYYEEYVRTNKSLLPYRSMAPETLTDMAFSIYSDIWAYGVIIWEIFSLAETPYPEMSFTRDFILKIQNGFRLRRPRLAPPEIYEEMSKCWTLNPEERPSFTQIKNRFKDLTKK